MLFATTKLSMTHEQFLDCTWNFYVALAETWIKFNKPAKQSKTDRNRNNQYSYDNHDSKEKEVIKVKYLEDLTGLFG